MSCISHQTFQHLFDHRRRSLVAVRSAARRGRDLSLVEGLHLEQRLAEPLRQTSDVQEGLRAFREKRDPDFEGR